MTKTFWFVFGFVVTTVSIVATESITAHWQNRKRREKTCS